MFEDTSRIPTYLWLEAKMQTIMAAGHGVYVSNRGEKMGGLILLKISDMAGQCKLLTQQRDIEGVLSWVNVFKEDIIEEKRADEYSARSLSRDPDLWVVEIEHKEMINLFID